jgi:transcriptional regulator with XRE-family HTH domain
MKAISASTDLLLQSDREAIRQFLDGLRQHRLKHNWSQVEMARRAGLSRPAYQNFENGYGNITLRNLLKILGVLGLTERFAQMIPPITEEPTLAALSKPVRQRARRRLSTVGPPTAK